MNSLNLHILFVVSFISVGNVRTTCSGVTFGDIGFVPAVSGCLSLRYGECRDPQDVQVRYFFYRKNSEVFTCNHTPQNCKLAPLDGSKRTLIITHAYKKEINGSNTTPEEAKKNMLLQKLGENVNVILVDWSNGSESKSHNYQQAVANSEVVGKRIAKLIEYLKSNNGLSLENVILQGFSLGAQVMGTAGRAVFENLQEKVAEIDGEDPAYPCFGGFGGKAVKHVLSSDDAKLVKVIHTDRGNKGNEKCGHIDIYPNNGKKQPGCPFKVPVFNLLQKNDCDHRRALKLTVIDYEKYEGDCQPIAYQCKNYNDFRSGHCASCENQKCQLMGYDFQIGNELHTPTASIDQENYYIKTTGNEPFCNHHFQIAAHSDSDFTCDAMKIEIKGQLVIQTKLTKYGGNTMTALVTVPIFNGEKFINPGPFEEATVWKLWYRSDCTPQINAIEVKYMSNMDESVRQKYSTKLCRKPDTAEIFVKCSDLIA